MHSNILQIQGDGIYNLLYVYKLPKDDVDPTDCFTRILLVTTNY